MTKPPKEGRSVYLLDDDETFGRFVVRVLEKHAIHGEAFKDVAPFLKRVQEKPPTLCIVDLNLSAKLKGYDLIEPLRRITSPELPVFIASATTDRASIAHAMEMGATDYILKPMDREVLSSKLGNFFEEMNPLRVQGGVAEAADIRTTLMIDAQLIEVDELGVSIATNDLVAKGCVVGISGDMIRNLCGREEPVRVTAISTSLEVATGKYVTFMEFDYADTTLCESVRTWITNMNQTSATV